MRMSMLSKTKITWVSNKRQDSLVNTFKILVIKKTKPSNIIALPSPLLTPSCLPASSPIRQASVMLPSDYRANILPPDYRANKASVFIGLFPECLKLQFAAKKQSQIILLDCSLEEPSILLPRQFRTSPIKGLMLDTNSNKK